MDAATQMTKEQAAALGFDACAIARSGEGGPPGHLDEWLRLGYHADMGWMEHTRNLRQDVSLKLPGAKSVIVVARNYYLSDSGPFRADTEPRGKVARYAWGRDYHKVLKKPLKALAGFIDTLEEGARSYASIDSGPILERTWAERAGLGWIGKNSLVLRRDLGSWFFLGAIISTVEFTPDEPTFDYCGTCTLCVDACPTGAIVAERAVDSRRCLSYQTIEKRGEIPNELHRAMGEWVFGCDICQDVCPWNRFAKPTDEADFLPREGVAAPDLLELVGMDEVSFNDRFEGTPVRRATFSGMRRNARIALENAVALKEGSCADCKC